MPARSRSWSLYCVLCIALLVHLVPVLCAPALATEGGGGAYSNGADDFTIGRMPPPGAYFFNYFTYYSAEVLKDDRGRVIPVAFDHWLVGNGFRLLYVPGRKLLGGQIGIYIVLPVADVHVELLERSQSKSGLGDMSINPCALGWHSGSWHFGAGVDVKAPTGSYSKTDLANIGRNCWTFEPTATATYLNKEGYELSAKVMYDLNTKNKATEYRSGQEFHADYTFGKKTGSLSAGIGGFYYQQITDDKVSGEVLRNHRGRIFATGPQARLNRRNKAFILKCQKEMLARNKPQGVKFWSKFIYRF